MKNMDEIFFYSIACDIVNESEDPDPRSIVECKNRHDWIKQKDDVHVELNLLNKRKVFRLIVIMTEVVRSVGYK